MNKHRLTYVDMYPEAVGRAKDVPAWRIVLGAVVTMAALYLATVFVFSL